MKTENVSQCIPEEEKNLYALTQTRALQYLQTYRNQRCRTTHINYYVHNKSSALIIVGYTATFTAQYNPSSHQSHITNCHYEAKLLK